jgi:hypothetical protein
MRYSYNAVEIPATGYAHAAAMNRAALSILGHGEVGDDDNPDVVIDHNALAYLPGREPGPLRIACTTWELLSPAPARLQPSGYDVVTMPSWFALRHSGLTGSRVRHGLPTDYARPSTRHDETFRFYVIMERPAAHKNLEGLVAAYAHAFTAEDAVHLTVKLRQGWDDVHNAVVGALAALCEPEHKDDLPAIEVVAEEWGTDEIQALHARSDCYVSLARGEAFGIPVLEAATMGNHVIVPEQGPYAEYLSATQVDYIRCHEQPAAVPPEFDGEYVVRHAPLGVSVRGRWVEPDRCHAASLMVRAVLNRGSRYRELPVDTMWDVVADWEQLLTDRQIKPHA